jgi:hypothetical protein
MTRRIYGETQMPDNLLYLIVFSTYADTSASHDPWNGSISLVLVLPRYNGSTGTDMLGTGGVGPN